MKLFCLFDRLAGNCTNVIEYRSISCFQRDFHSFMQKNPDSLMAKNPDDYDVLYLGDLSESGVLTVTDDSLKNLGSLRTLVLHTEVINNGVE